MVLLYCTCPLLTQSNMYIKSATDSWWGGRTKLQIEDWLNGWGHHLSVLL